MRLIGAPKHDVDALTDFILEFRKTLEIPNTLKDIGVPDDRADAVAQLAYDDPTRPGNPKPLTSDDLRTIFVNAVRGAL
jgi:alcohol dehydrogenase class IV